MICDHIIVEKKLQVLSQMAKQISYSYKEKSK